MNLAEIIKDISGFVRFFAPGFLFSSCLHFMDYTPREEKTEYLIAISVTLSFVLVTITELFSPYIPSNLSDIVLIIISIVLGFIVGRIRSSAFFSKCISFLFDRKINWNLFVHLHNRYCERAKVDQKSNNSNVPLCVRIKLKNDQNTYEGQLYQVINPLQEPALVLKYYSCYNTNGEALFDFSNYDDRSIILRYTDIHIIETVEF